MWQVLYGLPIKKIEYNYNSQDQLINYTIILDAIESKRFRYDYDKPGRMKNLLLYTGPEVDNPLDYINLAQYSYNSNSLVSLLGLNDNKLKNEYIYNDRNWIENCNSQQGVFSYNMLFFPNGNVQSLDYSGSYNNTFFPYNNLVFEFGYDKSNRLLSANCNSYSNKGFDLDNTYDRDGNILTLKRYSGDGFIKDDFNYTYYSNTNKLKKVSNIYEDFVYDNNGNLRSDDMNKNIEIKYDHRNLITLIKHRIYGIEGEYYTIAIYYYYDEAGNRIRKVILQSYINKIEVADSPEDISNYPEYEEETFEKEAKEYSGGEMDSPTTWFLVSNEYYLRGIDGKELANFIGSNIDKFNIWGRDNEGYLDSLNKKYYYLKDHLGSVRVVLDENNNIISAQDYDMWGSLMIGRSFESNKSKYKFTGKERDKESNYDYFGARYYDARIGRWGGVDPLMKRHYDFSPYNYVLNNSLKFIDPDGKQINIIQKIIEKTIKKLPSMIGKNVGKSGMGNEAEGFGEPNMDIDNDGNVDNTDEVDDRNDKQKFMDDISLQRVNEISLPDRLKPISQKKQKSTEELIKTIKIQIKEENEPKIPLTKIWDLPLKEIINEILY